MLIIHIAYVDYTYCLYIYIYIYILLPAGPHADFVSTGIILFSCVVLLLLITLMATAYYYMRKHDTIKKMFP